MSVRFCPRCNSDVQDVGDFCMLGHRFPVEDSLADLRAQVDAAFQKVEVDVNAVLDPLASLSAENDLPGVELSDPIAEEQMLQEMKVTSKTLWKPLEDESPLSRSDPIVAFAPSPRMDWGPERSKRRGR